MLCRVERYKVVQKKDKCMGVGVIKLMRTKTTKEPSFKTSASVSLLNRIKKAVCFFNFHKLFKLLGKKVYLW